MSKYVIEPLSTFILWVVSQKLEGGQSVPRSFTAKETPGQTGLRFVTLINAICVGSNYVL